MKIQKSQFDTAILCRDVYKMTVAKESSSDDIKSAIRNIQNGIIFCFVSAGNDLHALLEDLQFHLISIRSTYRYAGVTMPVNSSLPEGYTIAPFEIQQQIHEEDICDVATVIGSVNRYFLDNRIPKEKSREIYVQWIKNSLYNGFAERCFVAWYKGKVIGMCTVQIKNDRGHVDLFGILPDHQGKKIGRNLLHRALEYLQTRIEGAISVVTAGENIPANIFFQKNSFVIETVELVYHKHIGISP
jgi:ribosomal protein S18 acetylase RimI-like enzyme